MRRIDFYVEHMLKQDAESVVLVSDRPVEFRFSSGKVRRSSAAIDHKQILKLLKEAAPPTFGDDLRTGKKARFRTETPDNRSLDVEVDASRENRWQVVISLLRSQAANAQEADPFEDSDDAFATNAGDKNPFEVERDLSRTSIADSRRKPDSIADPFDDPLPERERPRARTSTGDAFGENPLVAARSTAAVEPRRAEREERALARPQERAASRPEERALAQPAARDRSPLPAENGRSKALAQAAPNVDGRLAQYLRRLVQVGGSDLHLSSAVVPIVRIGGEIQALDKSAQPLQADELRNMMQEITPPIDWEKFEKSHDVDFAFEIKDVSRFRMNYFVDRNGPGAVVRTIPFETVSPEKLGLPPRVLDLCWLTKGLVLVTGPTGSGKSTTLASLVDFMNGNRSDHIITIEDPIEFVHKNKKCLINQREVGRHTDSFTTALRAALREDPDIVLVGELRDIETISIAVETAETGHLVFGTLHTTTAASTVDRIIDQFPADEQGQIRAMLSESLRGVISQVLCKKRGGGRVAAYEVLLSNPAVSNLIREGKTFQLRSIMQTGRRDGMQTLNDHLFDLVKAGQVEPLEAYMRSSDKAMFKEMLQKARVPLPPELSQAQP